MMPHVLNCWIDEHDDSFVVMRRGADDSSDVSIYVEEFFNLFGFVLEAGKQVAIPFGEPGKATALHEEDEAA